MRVYCVCRAKGKEVTWRIRMFGASRTCREFNSWSTRPKPLSELLQDALYETKRQRLRKKETMRLMPGRHSHSSASLLNSLLFSFSHTHTPVNVTVCVVMDQDVESVGVAVCLLDEAVNSGMGALIHLDHVALCLPLRHTVLV